MVMALAGNKANYDNNLSGSSEWRTDRSLRG